MWDGHTPSVSRDKRSNRPLPTSSGHLFEYKFCVNATNGDCMGKYLRTRIWLQHCRLLQSRASCQHIHIHLSSIQSITAIITATMVPPLIIFITICNINLHSPPHAATRNYSVSREHTTTVIEATHFYWFIVPDSMSGRTRLNTCEW